MKITTRVSGYITLMAIRYKYKYINILGFISTDGDGSSEPGGPYLSCSPDKLL